MNQRLVAFLAIAIFTCGAAQAGVLYQDQMTDGTNWAANVGGSGDSHYTFNYNYALHGIPEAPNSEAGDAPTRGLKLEANQNGPPTVEFFTLYPVGQNFSGNYTLRFDAWQNFEIDGSGTTEFQGGGIGYDNVTADVASGAQAMSTAEGGSSNDWRAFKSPPQFFIDDADMAGGTHQGSDPYYADFLPAVAPPAIQGQVGTSVAGSPGFQWITWQFAVNGDLVTVDIEKPGGDQLRIVDIDCSDTSDGSIGCPTTGNLSLFYADFFDSVSSDPSLAFGVIDNVVVIPEPSSAAMILVGISVLALRRRRN